MQGGHLVHSQYFSDVAACDGLTPAIAFSPVPAAPEAPEQIRQLWPRHLGTWVQQWEPKPGDVLFLAGTDWRYLDDRGLDALPNPRLNLLQHVRHADHGSVLHGYLTRRAIRICVSPEVADVVSETGLANGPVIVIPNASDLPEASPGRRCSRDTPPSPVAIAGDKNPALAQALSEQLNAVGLPHDLMVEFQPRPSFLERLERSQIAVCIPRREEGFYLPALEAMSLGCLVVTTDCIGNRSFCYDDENCLIADYTAEGLFAAVQRALSLATTDRSRLLDRAAETVRAHSRDAQRARFHQLLKDIDQLW